MPKIVKYFSLILTHSSTRNEPGTWNSIQAMPSHQCLTVQEVPYYLHGKELEKSVDSAKYLGVTISKDLSWNSHIENITVSANRTLGFVKRNIKKKKNKKKQQQKNKKSGL